MALHDNKHAIEEVETVRCSIVEKEVKPDRMKFIKNILESNGYEVRVQKMEREDNEELYVVGVTDVTFNIILAVYEHALKTPDNKIVTVPFWNQLEKSPQDHYYWAK